ncbi:MAG TPA: alpha-L-fucosidase, partial [Chthonomonadaceae bacterium]|nr:alpha-L-fucosidase [Chthonomonadaceae bacterium]
SRFGYKDFIPRFQAEHYDPGAWADLFRRAGARFVVPVAEHHDGFAMYATSLSPWNAARVGPKRDLIGELAAAVRQQDMVFGVSSHRAEHWWFLDGGRKFDSDVQDPRYAEFYGPAAPEGTQPDTAFLDDWLARCCELVDAYQPQLFWFDWWIEQPAFAPYLQTFAAYYYNRGRQWGWDVAINYKNEAFPEGAAVFDVERGQLDDIRPHFWQTDTSISKNSWGYVAHQDYKTAGDILGDLIDIVSKNGALLLNIGPRPNGTIPDPEQQVLTEIGDWLAVNGEAIYSTRPWKRFGEGPTQVAGGAFNDTKRASFTCEDIRYTVGDGCLYAIVLAWPGAQATFPALNADAGTVREARLLGHDGPLSWSQDARALTVRLPDRPPCRHAFAFKVMGAFTDLG